MPLLAVSIGACSQLGGELGGGDTTGSANADDGNDEAPLETSGGVDGTSGPQGDSTDTTDTASVPGEGLPCDVDEVLSTYCRSCHGDPLVGTTFSLLSRGDLLASPPSDPGTTVGAESVERMLSEQLPMPPLPATPPSAAEIAVVADWVAAGMPAGDCMPDEEPSPFDADPVCTSDIWWTMGDEEDPRMHPGLACDACHSGSRRGEEEEGPRFAIAGTVYPSGHEPDDCFGVPSILVQVTDANDQVVELHTNSAGNFMLESEEAPPNFAPPYLVKVVSELGERTMAMPVETGDCNVCHTQDGTMDALGRIVAPW